MAIKTSQKVLIPPTLNNVNQNNTKTKKLRSESLSDEEHVVHKYQIPNEESKTKLLRRKEDDRRKKKEMKLDFDQKKVTSSSHNKTDTSPSKFRRFRTKPRKAARNRSTSGEDTLPRRSKKPPPIDQTKPGATSLLSPPKPKSMNTESPKVKNVRLEAISYESLRSVSPGSDSVFYSEADQVHCFHCGKEVEIVMATNDENVADDTKDIVQPPDGFADSPNTTKNVTSTGRLYKKFDKRFRSEDRDRKYFKNRYDIRAKVIYPHNSQIYSIVNLTIFTE